MFIYHIQAAPAQGCPAGWLSVQWLEWQPSTTAQWLLLASLPQLIAKATPKTRSGMVACGAASTASTWVQLPGICSICYMSWNGEPPMPAIRLRALVLWALCVSQVRFLSVLSGEGMWRATESWQKCVTRQFLIDVARTLSSIIKPYQTTFAMERFPSFFTTWTQGLRLQHPATRQGRPSWVQTHRFCVKFYNMVLHLPTHPNNSQKLH